MFTGFIGSVLKVGSFRPKHAYFIMSQKHITKNNPQFELKQSLREKRERREKEERKKEIESK